MNDRTLLRLGNRHGFSLLIYKAIMNVAVMFVLLLGLVPVILRQINPLLASGCTGKEVLDQLMQALPGQLQQITQRYSGWGYVLAVAISLLILLIWRKPRGLSEVFRHKGRPMRPGRFCLLLTLFMSGQALYQLAVQLLDWLLGYFHISYMEYLEHNAVSTDYFGMFLYVCILAPMFEELLFRGLILQSLMPAGKKFAILLSAVFFGLFHGSPLQAAFAAYTGLIMGYVASEYHIVWAIALHMINNWLFAHVLTRLLQLLPYGLGDVVLYGILLAFFLAALVIVVIKYRSMIAWWTREKLLSWQLKRYCFSPGMLVLSISCFADMALLVLLLFM